MVSTFRMLVPVLCLAYSVTASAASWNPIDWFKKPATPPYQTSARQGGMQLPKLSLPKAQPLPRFHMPELPKPHFEMPKFGMPPVGASNYSQSPGVIEKWNQGVERTKSALTLPEISPPSITPPRVVGKGSTFDLNPFDNPKSAQSKSLLPKWLSRDKTPPQQPPTLQNWLGQPKPQ